MPTVEFSPAQLDNMIRNIINTGSGIWGTTQNNSPSDSTLGNGYGRIVLFPGVMPAQPRLMTSANFSSALAHWNAYAENTGMTFTNPLTTTTTYKAAIATGTATWFALCYYNVNPPATNGSLQQRIIGTVGTIGSGADLEVSDTNIVTGRFYRVYNFRQGLPSTYTY